MAQTVLDILRGVSTIDNQTVLAVQSLLESQTVNETATVVQEDDEDIFQCGKCKKSFNSLPLFMSHKKTCIPPATQAITISTSDPNSNVVVSQSISSSQSQQVTIPTTATIQFPNSPISQINHGLVLSETDLLSLNLETTTIPHFLPSQQVSPSSNQAHQILTNSLQSSVANVQQPIIVNNLNGTALNVINQATVSIDSSGGLTVSNDSDKATFLSKETVQSVIEASKEHPENEVLDVSDLEKSTDNVVNIITEFHSHMVKQPKRSPGEKASSSVDNDEESSPKKGKLKCAYCNKVFAKNFDLQQHIRSHTGEKPFQCVVCGRAFAQKSNVKKHMQSHKVWPDGISQTLPKEPLEKITQDVDQITAPIVNGQDSTNVNAAGISVNATLDDAGQVQIVVDNSYVCPYCNFNGKNFSELKTHMKVHRAEKVYKCVKKDCGDKFTDLDPFLEHIKTHENEMEYCCHLCHKTFSSLYDLGVHQYSHSLFPNQGPRPGPKYYRCVKCMNKYASAAALEHHMATTSHRYPCTTCTKVFTCERYLRRHLLVHGTILTHKCTVCAKSFKTDHYLKMHMLIHTGETPFQCAICQKAFNRKDKLKRHSLIHVSIKRFKCPFRNHTGCMREFNRPDKLKSHILTHSGFKPFKCKECPRYFSRLSRLHDHERSHNEKFQLECEKCDKTFLNEHRFKDHKCNSKGTISQPAGGSDESEDPPRKRRTRSKKPQLKPKNDEVENTNILENEPSSNNITVQLGIVDQDRFEAMDVSNMHEYIQETKPCSNTSLLEDSNQDIIGLGGSTSDYPETTTIMVTSSSNQDCSAQCLQFHYDESESGSIIIHQEACSSNRTCTAGNLQDHSIQTEVLCSDQDDSNLAYSVLKDNLEKTDALESEQINYHSLTQLDADAVSAVHDISELNIVQHQDGSNSKFDALQTLNIDKNCDTIQLTLDQSENQQFAILQADENGDVECGSIMSKVKSV